jgi:tetratricopeptide (TPR) repeat protein
MAMGMSLTVSRGGFIGLAAGVAVFSAIALWLIWQTRRHFFWSLLAGGAVMALLAGIVLWRVNEQYLRERTERLSVTGEVRLGIWESALAQHAEQPWLGAGARMFYEGGTRLRSPRLPAWIPEPMFAHNEYLQTLADYGWVGMGLLLLTALLHAANGWRFLRWYVEEKFIHTGQVQSMNLALCVGALAALAATMAHAVFEFHGHVPATALLVAVLLGLLANPGFEEMARPQRRLPGVRLLAKGVLPVASAALLAGAWLHGRGEFALAQARLAQARKDESARQKHLDEAARLDPANPEIFYQRGLAALDRLTENDRSPTSPVLLAAIQDLETAVRLHGRNYLQHLALADAYDAVGRTEDALASIQAALRLAPHHEEPRLALGIHWHRLAQWQKAEHAYLWARQAWARNDEKQAGWLESYRLLLRHVSLIRRQNQPQR